MRLIDADELKRNVLKWMPSDPCGKEEKEFPFETDICVSMIMEIDEAPTIVPEPEWIPCSEKLPEEYGEYLVTYKSDGEQIFMDIVEYETSFEYDHEKNRFKGNWLFADDCRSVDPEVLAWMPLPEYYREGGEHK